jgi:hypothetical protein
MMSWWEWYWSLWSGDTLQCNLPYRITRALASPRWLPRGAKVLVIDHDPKHLIELFVFRGYDAVGLDAVNQRIVTAHHVPDAPLRFVNKALVLPEHYFDLVIARDLQLYQRDMSQTATRVMTANLLSSLKPAGKMSVLVRQKPTWQDSPGGHLKSCFERHFQQFGVSCQGKFIGDGWSRWRTWNWLIGEQPRWGYFVANATLTFDTLTRAQWHALAMTDHRTVVPSCCAWSRRRTEAEIARQNEVRAA